MTTGLDTTQTIRRAPGDLALSTFIAPGNDQSAQPWIQDHRLILHDLPYADDNSRRSSAAERARSAVGGAVAGSDDGLRMAAPNPFLRSAVGAVGSGAVRRRRQVVTVISASVLAVLFYLALQGTLLRPADPPITYSTTPSPEAVID